MQKEVASEEGQEFSLRMQLVVIRKGVRSRRRIPFSRLNRERRGLLYLGMHDVYIRS